MLLTFLKADTLRLKRPLGRVAALSVLTGLITLIVIEVFLRLPFIHSALPAPNFGTGSPELGLKIAQLDALVAQHGTVDCLFMGSSATDADGDAVAFAEGYRKSRGEEITCYNFALAGMPPVSAGTIARFLIARYQPHTLIYPVGAFELSDDFNTLEGEVYEKAWIKHIGGEASLEGWLFDNWAMSRYLSSAEYFLSYEYRDTYHRFRDNLNDYGLDVHSTVYQFQPSDQIRFPDFALSLDGLAGFSEFLGLQSSAETQLIIVEGPIYWEYRRNNYLGGGEETYQERFLYPVEKQAQAAGVVFIQYYPLTDEIFPQNGWNDAFHLNATGARAFSEWLGTQVGEAVAQGKLMEIGR